MLISSKLIGIVFGLISAWVAKKQGRNPYLWFFLGAIFNVFGLLLLYVQPKRFAQKKKKEKGNDPNTLDITPQFTPPHPEGFWYYLDSGNNKQGPMSLEGLIRSWKEGKLSDYTYVWNEHLDSWKHLKEFLR